MVNLGKLNYEDKLVIYKKINDNVLPEEELEDIDIKNIITDGFSG